MLVPQERNCRLLAGVYIAMPQHWENVTESNNEHV